MKVIITGATGMVGQGVLLECLADPRISDVLVLGRGKTSRTAPKLRELVHADMADLAPIAEQLHGYDACFYCLGISSVGMSEADYRRITIDMPLALAQVLAQINPGMAFLFVSGASTDASEQGKVMWARVKGEAENRLRRLPLRAVMFRPAAIQPQQGVQAKSAWIRAVYTLTAPLLGWLVARYPQAFTTTARIGRAMINVAANGSGQPILECIDINRVAGPDPQPSH